MNEVPAFDTYFHTFRVYPDETEMQRNATVFAAYLGARGWTIEAACAALGNWESECKLNPNYPQNSGFPTVRTGGFGLPQWSSWGPKIGNWASENLGITPTATDDNPLADIGVQMDYHDYSATHGDWYSNEGYRYTWEGFKTSTDDPRELAAAYYWQYERSGADDPGSRSDQAAAWYEFFGGVLPPLPGKKLPIWLLFKFWKGVI